jgi:hypothetical protein
MLFSCVHGSDRMVPSQTQNHLLDMNLAAGALQTPVIKGSENPILSGCVTGFLNVKEHHHQMLLS